MKKRVVLAVALSVALSVLAGCGSSGNVQKESANAPEQKTEKKNSNLEQSLAIDVSKLKSDDGQPLIMDPEKKEVPQRPADPLKLAEDDALRWFDMEYAGWDSDKINIPKSKADGAIGKKVRVILSGDHPYFDAYLKGSKMIADTYKMDFKSYSGKWDIKVQNQVLDQAIAEKPDMIILVPVDAVAATEQFKKINEAGIPVICSNTLPKDTAALKYALGVSAPDDWGQFRMIAQKMAEKMNYEGGYTIMSHSPGGSPYYARAYGVITELKKIAPKMKLLELASPGFDAVKAEAQMTEWLKKYGTDLKGVVTGEADPQSIGVTNACKKANRTDIIQLSAGNGKVSMDLVKVGEVFAITYQSAQADGAVPTKMAVDWFNGKEVEPVRYLPKHIITKDDVENYYPAQW